MIYVASPYSHMRAEVEQERYLSVCAIIAKHSPSSREPLFSPIAYWHPIRLQYDLPGDAAFYRKFNFGMLRKAQALWVVRLPQWEASLGVKEEIDFATWCSLPISYLDPNGAFVL